ncbi:Helix-turn-helix domain-containing protein [Paenibacillus sp. UNCCL117]|uniref:helix-turn-helix domain-containing protein n=1 Tax=unclassified Paenibacillus TaxID=185978 RepID=UPI00087E3FF5|nr:MULTISPECIES: helix-turn-helix domain-containing protein [unclassified Paenibacillus]SDC67091.1 Helix-turn-helix domain-containing protein [Paenibacillus sp. cl123]SFW23220.1 Helix-turn-helix domain-containing protein [Paenibacillus sp. UNCCL117]
MRNSNRLLRWNTLFTKLLVSFLCIIVLLLSFNLISITFFKKNVQDEIVRYNTLGLGKTVDGYEKHFSLIQNDLLLMSFNETLSAMAKPDSFYDYGAVASLLKHIQAMTNNTFLYMDNLLVYLPNQKYAIDKNGTSDTHDLFVNNFVSSGYSSTFWNEQFKEKYAFRVFPADHFRKLDLNGQVSDLGVLFPVVSKGGNGNNPFMLLALVDSQKLFDRFHFSINDSFLILDEFGKPLYSSGEGVDLDTSAFEEQEGYVTLNDHYYFYKKGQYSGFTYVNIISQANIASQVSKMNTMLLSILVAAICIGVILSIILSYKFNHPIQRTIEGMKRTGRPPAIQSRIHEWNWINEKMADMAQSNSEMSTDLTHKTSLLQQYSYLCGAKSLYPKDGIRKLTEKSKPFYLIVFQVAFSKNYDFLTSVTQEKACYYIQELINQHLERYFKDKVTLQAEKNQILTLIFDDTEQAELLEALKQLKYMVDFDDTYYQLTAAVNPKRLHEAELAAGFEECSKMLLQRSMSGQTEIMTELIPYEEDPFFFLPPAQERELAAQLQAGEGDRAVSLVRRLLKQMEQKKRNAHQFALFGKEVTAQLLKTLLAHHLDVATLMESHSPYAQLQQCRTVEELDHVLTACIGETCALVRRKKELHDPVKEFVLDYIEKHYSEDLSLEMAAEQLQRSRSYLSSYLKEKTGMTFTEYVQDLRIRKAKEMLAQKDIRINEVSERIGYQNVNSFIRIFKKLCGITPGDYRRLVLEGEQAAVSE